MAPDRQRRRTCLATLVLGVALIASACTGPILARPAAPALSVPAQTSTPAPPDDPRPIVLPRDDGPHARLTEWWYYTGHLTDQDGGTWGFEYVIFRAERGSFPVSWASHIAITDEANGTFTYAQRTALDPWVDNSPIGADGEPTGFDLAIALETPVTQGSGLPAWSMVGGGGRDRLSARMMSTEQTSSAEVADIVIDLQLSTDRPAALHFNDGWIDFGPAGGSYYYSRTRMDASGQLIVGDRNLQVTGIAWFDHQWGDFIAVGGGGWDWFAVNLDDGTDVTISVVRDAQRRPVLTYGTVVDADGSTRHVPGDAITLTATGPSWTSERTGTTYPSGWSIFIAPEDLVLELTPTVAEQELDTRPTTGVVYWEGSQRVSGTRGGVQVGGRGYVELTGYAN
ncbi:MAG: lipocalin family protein [Chloroflexota bacterium]